MAKHESKPRRASLRVLWLSSPFQLILVYSFTPGVLFITGFATMVTLVGKLGHRWVGIDNKMLDVLGVLLRSQDEVRGLLVKKTYIGLVQAFSVATKHAVREELGPFYTDLYHLIAFLPKFNSAVPRPAQRDDLFAPWENPFTDDTLPSGAEEKLYAVPLTADIEVSENQKGRLQRVQQATSARTQQAVDSASFFAGYNRGPLKAHWRGHVAFQGEECALNGDLDFEPAQDMDIAVTELRPSTKFPWLRLSGIWSFRSYLSVYVAEMKNENQIEDVFVGPFMASHSALQAALSDLSKLTSSPLPRPYTFQVQLFIWLYLIFLPFQLYPTYGYITIPAVAVAAIAFLGFLELACQLERPFDDRPAPPGQFNGSNKP
ncbi:hypothetical protein JCM24511_06499 [Saitozyma sp. JCM 24511]|nr:hypothetical protein JCM24511_06499 [Saitozyma sp. JCM 24511]